MGDLHTNKTSHISAPIDGSTDTEFHINKKDLTMECKVGENYYLCFPVECTSIEGDSERFKQTDKPTIESQTDENIEETSPDKMPLKKLKKTIQDKTGSY